MAASQAGSAALGESDLKRIRFNISVQKNRALVYTVAAAVGLIFVQAEVLKARYWEVLLIFLGATLSAFLIYLYHRWELKGHRGIDIGFLWMLADAACISWGVHITGGYDSAWYPWYLANISGAAFVAGLWWGFAVAVVDTVGYLAVLCMGGDVSYASHEFFTALFRMVCLYGASFFFLRGAADLKRKRQTIKALQENETRKVEELTRLTAALDQRTCELAEANVRIQEADRMKSRFLANMSHELRTPLNSIIGFSEILLDRLAGDIGEQFTKFLNNIHGSGKHLLRIINDILDLSKIEAGKMELNPEPVDLKKIVDGVCAVMKGIAAKREIRIDREIAEDLEPIEADGVKVKQILYNLVSNAVKFSYDGGVVTIRLEAPQKGDGVRITVTDRGVGISPEDQALVFEEFRQSEGGGDARREGTGLGLALVKRFADLHGGAVGVRSKLGEGSAFWVELPLAFRGAAVSVPEGTQSDEEPRSGIPRILVVEDDPSAFEAVAEHLAGSGWECIRAATGEDALRLARSTGPSVIILDIILPGMDGWEVLKRLKKEPDTGDIPVIIVSVQENRELGLTLGADDYFIKPVNKKRLLRRLEELLPGGGRRTPSVLVVDDDPDFHEMLDAMLSDYPVDLEHATTGKEGVEAAVRFHPDLIVLDLMMDGMDGFEAAAYLRNHPRTKAIPVLIVTAKDLTSLDREKLHGKVSALIKKGEGLRADLRSVVQDLLEKRGKESDHGE